MPFILVVLFAIALLVTLTGLVLSPRLPSSGSRKQYLVASRGRSMVKSRPAPAREGQRMSVTSPAPARERLQRVEAPPPLARSRRQMTEYPISTIPPRASRTTGRSNATSGMVAQPVSAGRSGASVPMPTSRGGLVDRLGSWRVAVPGLCALFLLTLYLFSLLFPHQAIWTSVWFGSSNPAPTPAVQPGAPIVYTASNDLIRLSQLDPAQYQSTQEYNTWAYSACSAAAMTEVINAYGHQYHITTILEVEAQIHEITPQDGLLEESGIAHTGTQFGFKTTWGHNLSLAQVITVANSGTPVIVSFPPDKFPGGHLLVVRGGDANYVDLADSSRLNMTQMTHERFMQLWGGFSAIMTPA
jgi:hypothetical protein